MSVSTCTRVNMGYDHDFSKKQIVYQSCKYIINICTCCGFSNSKLANHDDHYHTWNVFLGMNKQNFILKCERQTCKERIEFNPKTQDEITPYKYQNKRKYSCLIKPLETIHELD
jgi:hypothetical protein